MNRPTQSRCKIGRLLALTLPLGLAACGAQDSDDAFSEIALPTFSKDRVAQESPVEIRRMLSGDGFGFGALDPSPDGRWVTMLGGGELGVRDLATGEPRRVTVTPEEDGGWAEGSVFSPDGSRIAYIWYAMDDATEGYELRSVAIDGTGMKVHLSAGQEWYPWPEDWSKDGRYVLLTLFQTDEDGKEHFQIATLDVATNEIHVLRSGGARGPSGSFFSPDGRFVAFDLYTEEDAQERDIVLIRNDGNQETTLIDTPDDEQLLGFLPDGSGILFHRDAEDSRAIWKLPLRDGRPSGPPELVKDDVWDMTGLGFSDDAYFYGVAVSRIGIHTASFDLETGRQLEALEPLADRSGLGTDMATWSPDGTRIVYASAERGRNERGRSRLIVQSLTGEILQDLYLALEGVQAEWTAHNELVALARDQDGRQGFHRISLETGEVTRLKDPTVGFSAIFTVSEDREKIFIVNAGKPGEGQELREPGTPVIEYNIATGRERTLVEPGGYTQVSFPDAPDARITGGAVSPDGDKIAYQVRGGENTPADSFRSIEIFSRSSGETHVIDGLAFVLGATWSRDSRYVVVEGRYEATGDFHLLLISAEDGSSRSLMQGPNRFRRPSVSPDGRHINVTTGEPRQEIWRMTFNSGR